jgi:hypothetical protein
LTLLTVKSLISRNIPGLLRGFMPPKDSEQGLVSELYIYIWSKNFSHSVNEKSEAK